MKSNTPTAQICFGKVHHRRLRPVQHAFNYGVYFMRLPLRAMARNEASKNELSKARFFSHNRFNLLSFWEQDHGDGKQPLLDWIDALLEQEGISDADGEIWLQAFPRVLGYVFNPVSFWFCHHQDGQLRAVLAEVHNTFGERHLYLLDIGSTMSYGVELKARKIFHVSPFCAIEGMYRFRFMRAPQLTEGEEIEAIAARIDHDDASGPLLLTSIVGTAYPLSDARVIKAFFLYPLMSFGVVAKIHIQALRLWLKRVPFFKKPLPPSQELSR